MNSQLETRETPPAHPAVRAALHSLAQCAALLERVADAQYSHKHPALRGASIGQHVRHALDHFSAALAALDGQPIRYDIRSRGTPVESSRAAAAERVSDIAATLRALLPEQSEAAVTIRVLLDADSAETDLQSTLVRELAFATHHAIHHHAMILAAADALGVSLPDDFGKAPSTIRHERFNTASPPASQQ